jgi:hypothetical protein
MYRALRFPSLLAVFASFLALTQASAQGTPPASGRVNLLGNSRAVGTIDGIVSDTNLVPLQGAFVSVLGTSIRIGTGPNGRFRITKVPAGQYLLIVKRIGFRPTSAVIDVPATDTLRLAYTLEQVGVDVLNPVIVTEKSPSKKMADFEQRRRLGVGQFMDAQQIDAHNSARATEILRNFTTVNVSQDNSTAITKYYALSKREGANPQLGACPMQLYVDQVPLPSPFNLDLLPAPREIAGIEVYAGASTIPPQFNGYDRGCGVILVWTKDS